MGVTCTRPKDVARPEEEDEIHWGHVHQTHSVKNTRRPLVSLKRLFGRQALGTRSGANMCLGSDDGLKSVSEVGIVTPAAPEPMRVQGAASDEKKPPQPANGCCDGTALDGEASSIARYPEDHILEDNCDSNYSMVSLNSLYGLRRVVDLEPDDFRAIVAHTHAAAKGARRGVTNAHERNGGTSESNGEATAPQKALPGTSTGITGLFFRPSLGLLSSERSCGVVSSGTAERLSHQGERVPFTSIFESGLLLQRDNLYDTAWYGDAVSVPSQTVIGTGTTESFYAPNLSQPTISRQDTFGFHLPTAHSQAVGRMEDSGPWVSAPVTPTVYTDGRRPWRKPRSATADEKAVEVVNNRSVSLERGGYLIHYPFSGCCHQVRVTAALPPRASLPARSKTGRQWLQPRMEGPKSYLTRSQPLNVEAMLRWSMRHARLVPSPNWDRVETAGKE